jgi:hypothetical protein
MLGGNGKQRGLSGFDGESRFDFFSQTSKPALVT